MNILTFAADAAAAGQQPGGGLGNIGSIILIVAMVAIFYFLVIRPQRKEAKRKDSMLAAMAIGDTVLTSSGFYGVLIDIRDDTVIVEFGSNRNCRIPMQKSAIVAVEKPGEITSEKGKKVETTPAEETTSEASVENNSGENHDDK